MKRSLLIPLLMALSAPLSAQVDIQLPQDFSPTQGAGGITYESYFDNRSTPSTELVVPLFFSGTLSLGNGSVTHEGPTYIEDESFYPYVMNEEGREFLALHPGSGGAAVVSVAIPSDGVYCLEGSFARANDFENTGDGVVVSIFVDFDADAPLFETTISSAHVVDAEDVFQGTGIAPFLISPMLSSGQVLRLAVFPGAPDATDVGFDVTALVVTITSCGIFGDGFESGDLTKWL